MERAGKISDEEKQRGRGGCDYKRRAETQMIREREERQRERESVSERHRAGSALRLLDSSRPTCRSELRGFLLTLPGSPFLNGSLHSELGFKNKNKNRRTT